MRRQENRIVTKIVRDLCLLMLNNGVLDLRVEIKEAQTETVLRFISKDIKTEITERIEKQMVCKREIEVETYGFELLGDMHAQNELELLGCLTDSVNIVEDHGEVVIEVVRENIYGQ